MKSELKYVKYLENYDTAYVPKKVIILLLIIFHCIMCIFTITSFEFSEIIFPFNMHPPIAKILVPDITSS